MFDLQKVEMGWKECRDPREIEAFLLEEGIGETFARGNQHNPSLVNITVTSILPKDVPNKFYQLQSGLRGQCHTIKFHFGADSEGKLPLADLEEMGFERRDSFIWDLKHQDYNVSAIAIPNVKVQPYWVLQISKRRGKGLSASACEMASLVQKQLTLDILIQQENAS